MYEITSSLAKKRIESGCAVLVIAWFRRIGQGGESKAVAFVHRGCPGPGRLHPNPDKL
jgi:hypothetical protein